jgi:hypothetical protein
MRTDEPRRAGDEDVHVVERATLPCKLDGREEINASYSDDVETRIRCCEISTNPIYTSTASRAGLYGAPKSDRAAGSEAPTASSPRRAMFSSDAQLRLVLPKRKIDLPIHRG